MAECFCGCGRSVPFGRRRVTNTYGGKIAADVAMLEGARGRAPGLVEGDDVPLLITQGDAFRTTLAGVVHGEVPREEIDKDALGVWWKRMQPYRVRMIEAGAELEGSLFGGRNAKVALTGTRTDATLVRVEDTGTTVNDLPRVRLIFEARPEDGPVVEIAITRNVPRLRVPQPGIVVPVAYDPADPQGRHTFEEEVLEAALAAGPPPAAPALADPIDRLVALQALHASGGLTDEEFAIAKARTLDGM